MMITQNRNFTLLVIEDELKQIRGTLRGIKRSAQDIDVAESKIEAENYLQEFNYDLVIVDLRIPESQTDQPDYGKTLGLSVVKNMMSGKLGDKNIRTKFIIVTAQKRSHGFAEDMGEQCLGVFGKLKPFDVINMVEAQIETWRVKNE